jgi:hypothetical protein
MDVNCQLRDLAIILLEKVPTVPIELEAGWASEPVRMFWRCEKYCGPATCTKLSGLCGVKMYKLYKEGTVIL